MDAPEILDRLQPLTLIVYGRGSSHVREFIEKAGAVPRRAVWDELDTLTKASQNLDYTDPYYPILLLHLADAYRRAGELKHAEFYCTKALEILRSRIDDESRQNAAVLTSYLGIILHLMGRIDEAAQFYDQARHQFQVARLNWERHPSAKHHANQCYDAATQLEHFATKLLESTMGQDSGQGSMASTWHPPSSRAVPPMSPLSISPARSMSVISVVILALAVCLWILAPGFMFLFLGGPRYLAVYIAAVATLATATFLAARSSTGNGLLLSVPWEQVAVVEQNSLPVLVGPVQRWLLVPWFHRVRSLVPLRELTCTLPKHKVSLGKHPQKDVNIYLVVTIQIRYKVVDPIEATYFFDEALGGKPGPKRILRERELRKNWESQLRTDLAPLLVDQLWGGTEADCSACRQQIQTYLKRDLTRETRRWGVDIEELTILEINTQ